MNIVIAPDSFKGSLQAQEAALAIQEGFHHVFESAIFSLYPMADGGEGTLHSFSHKKNLPIQTIRVLNAYGNPKDATLLINKNEAIIEVASVVGLTDFNRNDLKPELTTSYGVGELITYALNRGCTKIIIGLGGSATNDGGAGMLEALGVKFKSQDRPITEVRAKDLAVIDSIDLTGIDERLTHTEILIASDVNNRLVGSQGATAVFGPQKGVHIDQIKELDSWISSFGNLLSPSLIEAPGAGAAGGLGFALLSLGGRFEQGAKVVGEALGLSEAIQHADLVITGEGRTDDQTAFGKVPHYVAMEAKKWNKPVLLISGSLDLHSNEMESLFTAMFSIMHSPCNLEFAIKHARLLTAARSKEIAKTIAITI